MISLDDLTTPVTKEEVKKSLYDMFAAVGVSTTSWKSGAVVRTIVAGVSIVFAAQSQLAAKLARLGFLALSSGDWLTLVARYVYNLDRIDASFATGEITLENTGGGTFSYDALDVVFLNPTSKKTYRNAEAFTLDALETKTIPIIAIEAGASSTSTPDTITELVTTMIAVEVSNELAVVGEDDESDTALIARCLEKLGALSPFGPWDAYAFAAKGAKRSDGTTIGVTRVRSNLDGGGNVTTYVATATGAVTGDADDEDTDLGAVNEAIQRNAPPLGITAFVESAVEVVVPVTYQAWAYNTSGLTTAQIMTQIATSLANLMAAQPVGGNVIGVSSGKLYASAIKNAVHDATTTGGTRLPIFRVEVSVPAGDVSLGVSEVPVLGTITGTVTQVAPPEGFF